MQGLRVFAAGRAAARPRTQLLACGIAIVLALAGCIQVGPRALSAGRPMYNIALQQTEAQEVLLNIVRQRYNDPLLFLDVTSISSGFSTQASAGLVGSIINEGRNDLIGNASGAAGETPFIFYAPNSGEKFVRQMLTPVDLSTIALILQAGWSIERVFLILGESVDQMLNTMGGADRQERYLKLKALLSALRALQRDGMLIVGSAPAKDREKVKDKDKDKDIDTGLSLVFTPDAIPTEHYRLICDTLDTACDGKPLRLQQAFGGAGDPDTLSVATRSLFSAFYFLAQGVDVPDRDEVEGNARRFTMIPGGPFDTASGEDVLFHVRTSDDEPEKASVKVFYRNAWFYIADNDADTKVTFALLSMLLTLQAGATERVTPMITLPVN